MQDVWGDKDKHGFHINISKKISKLFKELWDDENIPKKYKLGYKNYEDHICKIIRLPWFNVAILDGSIISLNQLDDILDATRIANEELTKKVDSVHEEFAKNPTTNDKPYGEVLSYYKDSSQKLKKDCEK